MISSEIAPISTGSISPMSGGWPIQAAAPSAAEAVAFSSSGGASSDTAEFSGLMPSGSAPVPAPVAEWHETLEEFESVADAMVAVQQQGNFLNSLGSMLL